MCPLCDSDEAEDQTHMLATCKLYKLERKALVDGVGESIKPEQVAAMKAACLLDPDQWPAELLSNPACDTHVRSFLASAFGKRARTISALDGG